MTGSKRSHTKSRRGCSQCKQRHVRCDEGLPSCAKCTRRGIRCDFQDMHGSLNNLQLLTPESYQSKQSESQIRRHEHPQSLLTEEIPPTLIADVPALGTKEHVRYDTEDVILMHHYTLHTSLDIAPIESEQYKKVWQTSVPLLAQSYPFLLRCILAISAAHKATTRSSETNQYVEAARRHHTESMRLFGISASETPLESKACAVFPFCILVMLVSFSLDSVDDWRSIDPVASLVDNLVIIRSSCVLLGTVREHVLRSNIGLLLDHTRTRQSLPVPEEVIVTLERIQKHVGTPAFSATEQIAYEQAISQLRTHYEMVGLKPKNWSHLLQWPMRLSQPIHEALAAKQLPALIMLAYWCVPLHHAPKRWFFGNWAARTIVAVAAHASSTLWSETMAWPLAQAAQVTGSAVEM